MSKDNNDNKKNISENSNENVENSKENAKKNSARDSCLSREQVSKLMQKEVAKLTRYETIQDIIREKLPKGNYIHVEEDNSSDEDSFDDIYKLIDRSNSTKYESVIRHEEEMKRKESNLPKKVPSTIKEVVADESFRELLKWNFNPPEQRRQLFSPRHKTETSEMCEILAQSVKPKKKEFEIVPPNNFIEENDIIMYPKKSTGGYRKHTNTSYNPSIQKTLNVTPNYNIFSNNKKDEKLVSNEECITENSPLLCSTKIAEVRQMMKDFNKSFSEFSEKSLAAKENIAEQIFEAAERHLEIKQKVMDMKHRVLDMQTDARKTVTSAGDSRVKINEHQMSLRAQEMKNKVLNRPRSVQSCKNISHTQLFPNIQELNEEEDINTVASGNSEESLEEFFTNNEEELEEYFEEMYSARNNDILDDEVARENAKNLHLSGDTLISPPTIDMTIKEPQIIKRTTNYSLEMQLAKGEHN